MPHSKYTKVPGPAPPIEQIKPSTFQFDDIARRKLLGLLPLRLHRLDVPEEVAAELVGGPKLSTIAELIVVYTGELISAYLTEKGLSDRTPANPANVKTAIRKSRKALEL